MDDYNNTEIEVETKRSGWKTAGLVAGIAAGGVVIYNGGRWLISKIGDKVEDHREKKRYEVEAAAKRDEVG